MKPDNILLDAADRPRITDFGIAKCSDTDSRLTQAGAVIGTPSYMSPEQAQGHSDRVGPPSDVYALGATLYCLLTGRPPFQAATALDTLKHVVERDPVSPRRLNPAVDRDLETICLKCLEKAPERRYASATALAEDLRRFLDRRSILARPASAGGKAARWCWRNPMIAGSLAGVVAIFLTAFALVSWSYWREAEQRAAANEARDDALRHERGRALGALPGQRDRRLQRVPVPERQRGPAGDRSGPGRTPQLGMAPLPAPARPIRAGAGVPRRTASRRSASPGTNAW